MPLEPSSPTRELVQGLASSSVKDTDNWNPRPCPTPQILTQEDPGGPCNLHLSLLGVGGGVILPRSRKRSQLREEDRPARATAPRSTQEP